MIYPDRLCLYCRCWSFNNSQAVAEFQMAPCFIYLFTQVDFQREHQTVNLAVDTRVFSFMALVGPGGH